MFCSYIPGYVYISFAADLVYAFSVCEETTAPFFQTEVYAGFPQYKPLYKVHINKYSVPLAMDSQWAQSELEELFTYTDANGCERRILSIADSTNANTSDTSRRKLNKLITLVLMFAGTFVWVWVLCRVILSLYMMFV